METHGVSAGGASPPRQFSLDLPTETPRAASSPLPGGPLVGQDYLGGIVNVNRVDFIRSAGFKLDEDNRPYALGTAVDPSPICTAIGDIFREAQAVRSPSLHRTRRVDDNCGHELLGAAICVRCAVQRAVRPPGLVSPARALGSAVRAGTEKKVPSGMVRVLGMRAGQACGLPAAQGHQVS